MDDTLFLQPTATMDHGHPLVAAFVEDHAGGATSEIDAAVRLFHAVRDGIAYDPYTCVLRNEALRASATLEAGRAWCVPKAILLAAALRRAGIPARLGFADVRNHLSTERLRELMGSDVYAWHGSVSMRLGGRWVKATPAFDARLTRRFGMIPIEFDGRSDSLLHPLDAHGRDHIEYVADRGEHADLPLEEMRATFEERYPRLLAEAERRASTRGGRGGRGAARPRR